MRLTDNTILVTGALAASAARLQRLFTRATPEVKRGRARTPVNTTPTSFRLWCEEVLKPAVFG